jgi:hypothetical protein
VRVIHRELKTIVVFARVAENIEVAATEFRILLNAEISQDAVLPHKTIWTRQIEYRATTIRGEYFRHHHAFTFRGAPCAFEITGARIA